MEKTRKDRSAGLPTHSRAKAAVAVKSIETPGPGKVAGASVYSSSTSKQRGPKEAKRRREAYETQNMRGYSVSQSPIPAASADREDISRFLVPESESSSPNTISLFNRCPSIHLSLWQGRSMGCCSTERRDAPDRWDPVPTKLIEGSANPTKLKKEWRTKENGRRSAVPKGCYSADRREVNSGIRMLRCQRSDGISSCQDRGMM
ncbi:unnamed protein product [Arabidopsis arenosa]|uniref:Uncharacterized protein n=1 Tax=Arabidopsis arenosa TaxID=38785 RepID=A0A8S1ZZQ8_ARAAE|nr:unnamed protein product [Arabidopsis arenosa]